MQQLEHEKRDFGAFQRLPKLEPGVNLVTGEEKIVRQLVAQRLHSRGGECLWIDAKNNLYQKPSIPEYEKEKLLAEALGKIVELSETRGIPAVVTQVPGELQWMLETVASQEIKARSTSHGPSVETDDFTPEAYPDGNGFQTRVNHWTRETEVVKLGTN